MLVGVVNYNLLKKLTKYEKYEKAYVFADHFALRMSEDLILLLGIEISG